MRHEITVSWQWNYHKLTVESHNLVRNSVDNTIKAHCYINRYSVKLPYYSRKAQLSLQHYKWCWISQPYLQHPFSTTTWGVRMCTQSHHTPSLSPSHPAHLVEISIAICTDLERLSLMCWSIGSILWMSMLVITCITHKSRGKENKTNPLLHQS